MRQIKFRAWSLNDKKIFYNVYVYPGNMVVDNDDKLIGYSGIDVYLMQSTGLLDKNGKEIYEGDIIKYSGNSRYWTVYWNEVVGQFRFKCYGVVSKSYGDYAFHSALEYRIVGNIYQNPELINR